MFGIHGILFYNQSGEFRNHKWEFHLSNAERAFIFIEKKNKKNNGKTAKLFIKILQLLIYRSTDGDEPKAQLWRQLEAWNFINKSR